jgi:predicted phosphodiesterase
MANQHTGGKWNVYDEQIKKLFNENEGIENSALVDKLNLAIDTFERQALLKYIRRNKNRITDDYEGSFEVSDAVNMPSKDVPHYWDKRNPDFSVFVKNPNYIGANANEEEGDTFEEIKEILILALENVTKYTTTYVEGSEIANIVIGDPHLGAYIDGLVNTKDFSIPILIDYIEEIVVKVNKRGFKEVNVFFLGDMIESFTGLNHKNSWKGLQKGMIGAEVIRFSVKIWHDKFLSKLNNLKKVKLVAGNHDRLTSDKDEDTDGGAADLIAFGLELLGYDIEFHPTVISCEIDGINYILLHGHKGISRKTTKDICWDFGKKGVYNVILEGHLHSIIQKLSVNMKGKFNILKDDSVDHIRMHARSLFTGNGYSEDLGFTSNAGFSIITNNGKGLPDIDNKLL